MSVKNTIRKGVKIAVVAGTVGAGVYLTHDSNPERSTPKEPTKAAGLEFYQNGCKALTVKQPKTQEKLGMHFTKSEADKIANILQDENSLAHDFIKKVKENMEDPYYPTLDKVVDKALDATLSSGSTTGKDTECVFQIYQIFKNAVLRPTQKGTQSLSLGMDEKVSNIIQNLKRSRE